MSMSFLLSVLAGFDVPFEIGGGVSEDLNGLFVLQCGEDVVD